LGSTPGDLPDLSAFTPVIPEFGLDRPPELRIQRILVNFDVPKKQAAADRVSLDSVFPIITVRISGRIAIVDRTAIQMIRCGSAPDRDPRSAALQGFGVSILIPFRVGSRSAPIETPQKSSFIVRIQSLLLDRRQGPVGVPIDTDVFFMPTNSHSASSLGIVR
jgi:hypothetical protein